MSDSPSTSTPTVHNVWEEAEQYEMSHDSQSQDEEAFLQTYTKDVLVGEDQKVLCRLCNKWYASKNCLRKHLKNVHFNHHLKPWICDQCGKALGTKSSLVNHVKVVHNDNREPVKCPKCYKRFLSQNSLKQHIAAHNKDYKFFCQYCKKGFYSKTACRTHEKIHTGDYTFHCPYCEKRYRLGTQLKKHMRYHQEGAFPCSRCLLVFSSITALREHASQAHSHIESRRFVCNECNAAMATRNALEMHIKRHLRIRPHVCDDCGRDFASGQELKAHIIGHLGIKQYLCTVCGRKFARKDSLVIHMRTHTGEKPYECDICHKCFSQNTAMKVHRRTHKPGEKHIPMLTCSQCGLKFTSRLALCTHTNNEHSTNQ